MSLAGLNDGGCDVNRRPLFIWGGGGLVEWVQCCQPGFTGYYRSRLMETRMCWLVASFYFRGVFGDKWLYLHGQDVTIPT